MRRRTSYERLAPRYGDSYGSPDYICSDRFKRQEQAPALRFSLFYLSEPFVFLGFPRPPNPPQTPPSPRCFNGAFRRLPRRPLDEIDGGERGFGGLARFIAPEGWVTPKGDEVARIVAGGDTLFTRLARAEHHLHGRHHVRRTHHLTHCVKHHFSSPFGHKIRLAAR